ncbi:MAG: hypothetical protein CMN32_11370 [Saprospirales bacterium]|nr:hypothetical protein [Saprospirales bacterium]
MEIVSNIFSKEIKSVFPVMIYLFVLTHITGQISAQDTSFQLILDDNITSFGNKIYISQDGHEMYLWHRYGSAGIGWGFNLIPLKDSLAGNFVSYEIGNSIQYSAVHAKHYYFANDNLFVALGPISSPLSDAFLKVNLKDGIAFMKRFPAEASLAGSIDGQSIFFAAPFSQYSTPVGYQKGIQFGQADLDLNIQWIRSFEISSSLIDSLEDVGLPKLVTHSSGYYYCLWNISDGFNLHPCVLKFDTEGNVVSGQIIVGGGYYDDIKAASDGVYLTGSVDTIITDQKSNNHLLLTKVDLDLNPLWSKVYFAESFKMRQASLSLIDDTFPVVAYSTFGYFPTILARLDQDGNITEQKGYPLYSPLIGVLPDGSLVQLSVLWNQGNVKTIVSKTKSDGSIDGCPVFPTCLNYLPRSFDTSPLSFSEIQVGFSYTEMVQLAIDSTPVLLHDYCDIPMPPSGEFQVQDTICNSQPIMASGQQNINAHGIKWNLVGPGLDTAWLDSQSVYFVPDVPGTYMLSQTVWHLGCSVSDTSIITVLPPLSIGLPAQSKLCNPPGILSLDTSRPLTNLTWSTGETTHSIEITTGGHYAVTATDGYCTATDSIDVVFVSETLGGQPPLELPPDTTVCRQHLPYMLSPQSNFTDSFLVNGRLHVNTPAELFRPGEYEVAALIEGCAFPDTFQLDTSACHVKVYFPSAFSPNGDGINDEYKPLAGKDVEMLELWIFDRWGGLRHHSKGALGSWDGRGAPEGTYVAKLKFRNLLTGFEEMREADFTLLR